MRWSVIFASIYITEKEGDFGQFKGKFFIFMGCDSFSALNLVDMTTVSGKEKAARRCGPPGICRWGPSFGFSGKKIPASKAGSILPYYGGGDNARKNFVGGEILSHTMIFF